MQNFGLILKNQQNVRHSQLFENNKDAINLEILQLASSNLHKRYMVRKASIIVFQLGFKNKMAVISHVLYHMGLS